MASRLVVVQQNQPASSSALFHSSLSSDFNDCRLTHSVQFKRNAVQPKGALHVTAASSKKILIMGGTRFIGIFLSRLVKEGHHVTLFTRGKAPIAQPLPGESDADFADFSSKADAVDPKCRHKGKLDTESLLDSRGVNWTALRPVYIYAPLNYNPVEEWFFHRLKEGRPIHVPGSGLDLAKAFVLVLGNEKASKEVFNITREKHVTFDGLARACEKAGGFPEPEIIHYNPKDYDFGKKKSFPFRDQLFASIEKAKSVLGWKPEFDLVEGLTDSYNLDIGRGTFRKAAAFSTDDMILGKTIATV